MTSNLARLEERLNAVSAKFAPEKAKFLQELEIDPVNALEWSGTFIRAVAREKMAKGYLTAIRGFRTGSELSEDEFFALLVKDVQKNVNIIASTGSNRSSSVMANLMREEKMIAHASLIENLQLDGIL